jgi:hypothetical protein
MRRHLRKHVRVRCCVHARTSKLTRSLPRASCARSYVLERLRGLATQEFDTAVLPRAQRLVCAGPLAFLQLVLGAGPNTHDAQQDAKLQVRGCPGWFRRHGCGWQRHVCPLCPCSCCVLRMCRLRVGAAVRCGLPANAGVAAASDVPDAGDAGCGAQRRHV